MSQSNQFIQELGEGQTSIDPASSVQNATQRCLRSNFLNQLDVFAASVNLNICGSDVSQTKLGGVVSIVVNAFCIWLTIVTFFSDGLSLKSRITMTTTNVDQSPNATLFDYADQFIRINMYKRGTGEKVPILQNVTINGFFIHMLSNGTNITIPLNLSKNCQASQLCLKKQGNKLADISGANVFHSLERPSSFIFNPNLTYKESKQIYFQMPWARSPTFPASTQFKKWQINFDIAQKKILKYGKVDVFYNTYKFFPSQELFLLQEIHYLNIAKINLQYNNPIMGHIGNILPSYTFGYSNTDQSTYKLPYRINVKFLTVNASALTNLDSVFCLYLRNTDAIQKLTQQFDDISLPILFFLSVKQTLYLLAVTLIVTRYNINSNLLKISKSLYTMQDHISYEKFDFDSFSPSIIVACFLHNHPLNRAIDFLLQLCGKNIYQIVPRKCFYSMIMMKKAEQLLSENSFFGGLEQLSALQDQPPKKIVLVDQYDQQHKYMQKIKKTDQQEVQVNYFPKSQIKRVAFEDFCKTNELHSATRKNHFYRILASKNLQLSLPQLVKKHFKSYVDNVKIKVKEGKLNLQPDQEDDIPVQLVNDKQLAIRKDTTMFEQQQSCSNLKMMKQDKVCQDQKLKASFKLVKSGKQIKKLEMNGINQAQEKWDSQIVKKEQQKNLEQEAQNSAHIQLQSFNSDEENDI